MNFTVLANLGCPSYMYIVDYTLYLRTYPYNHSLFKLNKGVLNGKCSYRKFVKRSDRPLRFVR